MKKHLLLSTVAISLSFGMSAQLQVIGNGSVQVGSFAVGRLYIPGASPFGISVGPGTGSIAL